MTSFHFGKAYQPQKGMRMNYICENGSVMTSKAVNFEYEWMGDGSLRLRFLNEENAIIGQQFIATDGLVGLQLLISLAIAKDRDVDLKEMMAILRSTGINADLDPLDPHATQSGGGFVGTDRVDVPSEHRVAQYCRDQPRDH